MKYSIEDLCSAEIYAMKRPQQVERLVCYILESANKTSIDNTYSTDEILEDYRNLCKTNEDKIISIPENTIITTVSLLAKDSSTSLYSAGKKRGYYLIIEEEKGILEDCAETVSEDKISLEKLLYPTFRQWLSYYCDKAKIIADNRSMHKWGNPDLIGGSVFYILGQPQIEITTIEVKKDLKDWRRNIFEAVAHTLFAHKVYFACVCDEAEYEKEKRDMLLYAQQFQIGILVLVGEVTEVDNIREIIPAPTRCPNTIMYQKFLEGLQLLNMDDFYRME